MLVSFLIAFLLVFQIFLVLLFAVMLYILARGLLGVPYVRTKKEYVDIMMELAGIQPGDVLVDFGSGDGAIVIEAAKTFGAKGIGFEYLRPLVWYAKICAIIAGVFSKIEFRRENFLSGKTLPKADVISSYLFPEVNAKLEPLLIRDYPSGTRVVSRTFLFPTLPLKESRTLGKETFYLYLIP